MNANPDFVLLDEEDSKIETIGKYRVLSVLGSGGMGVVYKARDPEVGRDVAIKTLKRTKAESGDAFQDVVTRFKLEARSAGNLRHPNIVTVYEANYQDGLPYIVMEHIEGTSLESLLSRDKRIVPKMAIAYLDQVAGGLDYAHSKGVIHRDIKPSNVMIDRVGNAYILDFGVANLNLRLAGFQNQLTKNPVYGTPGYMAPEQLLNRVVDHRTDIFSLAVLMFECLSGQKPFQGNNVSQVIDNTIQGKRPPISTITPELPQELDAVFDRALSVRPELRFDTAESMMAAFFHALGAPNPKAQAGAGQALSFSTKAERIADTGSRISVEPQATPKKKIERPSETMATPLESGDASAISAWGWQQRMGSDEELSNYLSAQQKIRNTPGKMFAHVGESIAELGSGASREKRLRTIRLVAGVVFLALVCGIATLQLTGSLFEPQPISSPSSIAAPPIPVVSLPAIDVPDHVAIEDLTDREVLALALTPAAKELRVVEALHEARRRGVPRLVDVAPVVLRNPSSVVRAAAARIYGEVGDRRVLPYVLTLLEDGTPEVRRSAAVALATLGDSKSLDYLRFRHTHEIDSETKALLKLAIEQISGLPLR